MHSLKKHKGKANSTQAAAKKKVLIVDNHPIIRHGLSLLINAELDLLACGEANCSSSALSVMRKTSPDVVLLDIELAGTNGIELIKLMKAERPHLPILVFSLQQESLYALRALKAGALGYVMKSEELCNIVSGLRKVLAGEIYLSSEFSNRLIFKAIHAHEGTTDFPADKLSDRELEIFEFIGQGFSTKEIAVALTLSAKTIETHRTHIKEKFHCKDAHELVRFAIDWKAHKNS